MLQQQHDQNDVVSRSQQPVSAPLTVPTTTTTTTTTLITTITASTTTATTTTSSADVAPTYTEPSAGKKRRGRPPRAQGKSPAAAAVAEEEEDVCFICFDGGSLVLCDRRGCPKAYHPACVKRDEAFFRSKAKWNCGWHICSTCQKASHYQCYTCTFSLCKGCTRGADYVCIRENFGLCGTCMRTIVLIENIVPGNKEKVQVDFDDKTSWEYLFKIYWVYLKTKLSLTIEELTKAKNPWKGDELPKAQNTWRVPGAAYVSNGDKRMSDNGLSETNHYKRTKTTGGTRSGVVPQPVAAIKEVSSLSGLESDKLWHYQDPTGMIQGPFSMMQLRQWSANGLFPLDLRVWRITEKQENSILLTDALVGKYQSKPSQSPVNFLHQGPTTTSNETDKKWQHGLNLNIDANLLDNQKNEASVGCNSTGDLTESNKGDGFAKSLFSEHELSSKLSGDQAKAADFPVLETKLSLGQGLETEKCMSSSININKTDGYGDNEKRSVGDCHPMQSADSISSGFVSSIKPIETTKQNSGKGLENIPNPTSTENPEDSIKVQATENNKKQPFCLNLPLTQQSNEDLGKVQAAENNNKQSFCLNVPLLDSQHNWSTASSLAAREWSGYASAPSKASVEEWDFNIVPSSSLKLTVGTSGGDHASSWQPIMTDPSEFCSFADESVSDLLAEVEAMESMGGFPSPTSKMSSGVGELTRGPDHDFFSPVEGFSTPAEAPALAAVVNLGKSDPLSSTTTTDMHLPSQLIVANMLLQLSMPSRPAPTAEEPVQESQTPSQTSDPVQMNHGGLSQLSSQSNFIYKSLVTVEPLQPSISSQDGPLGLSHQNYDGQSSSGTHVAEDTGLNNIKDLHQDSVAILQTPASSLQERGVAPEPKPSPSVVVTKAEAAPETHHAPPSAGRETLKGNPRPGCKTEVPPPVVVNKLEATPEAHHTPPSVGRETPKANQKSGRETGNHQQNSTTTIVTATGNQPAMGIQPSRHGGDRYSSHLSPRDRDHRNHSHFRDSSVHTGRDSSSHGSRDSGGYGRDRSDRSCWSRQQHYGNGSSGVGSHRQAAPPLKGMRVCKYFENGYCKKGASCSFWHP